MQEIRKDKKTRSNCLTILILHSAVVGFYSLLLASRPCQLCCQASRKPHYRLIGWAIAQAFKEASWMLKSMRDAGLVPFVLLK